MDIPTCDHSSKESPIAKEKQGNDLVYGIEDIPPWYTCILLGLQQYLTMFSATVSIPFILCPMLCMERNDPARGYIISTILFISGIVTFLQTTFGVRLPIVQGGTFTFLAPTIAILTLDKWRCPSNFDQIGWGNISSENKTELWQLRMREVQGAIIVSNIFQVVMGYTGLIGVILPYITPLTITPAISMVGLSLFEPAANYSSKHWGIALGTIICLILFSQYLGEFETPFIGYSKNRGFFCVKFKIFKILTVLISILLMWCVCFLLTIFNVLEKDSAARTDIHIDMVYQAKWIRVPYPFQWGWPTFSSAGIFGMLAGVIASIIESIGDYYACARLSGAPQPPRHAINRGIGTEGLGCVLAGIWGTGNGTTSYSQNIAAIGITKVSSRRVIQTGALFMILCGIFNKFGTCFLAIPEPIVGGIFFVMFGIITAVGLANLQFVDLNSMRNLFIIGFSIFVALALPNWINSNYDAIKTGNATLDQVITVLLSTNMFVGGFIGFVLDNTISGDDEERGIAAWKRENNLNFNPEDENVNSKGFDYSCYDFPFGMKIVKRLSWMRFLPFSPTFRKFPKTNLFQKGKIKRLRTTEDEVFEKQLTC